LLGRFSGFRDPAPEKRDPRGAGWAFPGVLEKATDFFDDGRSTVIGRFSSSLLMCFFSNAPKFILFLAGSTKELFVFNKKMQRKVPMRRNGFQRPFNLYQMSSWFIVAFIVLSFYITYLPLCDINVLITLAILYTLSVAATVTIAAIATYVNAIDPAITEDYRCKATGEQFDNSEFEQMCTICDAHVHDDSKHCG
jgi:hypothetical protein